MPTYNRADLAFERGEGAWLWTVDGRRFLDFGSGIATTSIGHAHPHLVQAVAEQAAKVMHVSNLYRVPQAERLARQVLSLPIDPMLAPDAVQDICTHIQNFFQAA